MNMIFEKSNLTCSSSVTHVHNEQPDVHQIVLTNDYKGNEIEIELYELNLDIDVSKEEFTTDLKIKFKVLNSRQFLVLKNGNYEITSIALKKDRIDHRLEGIIDYKPTQSLILHLEQKLSPNDYVLIIKTKGQINKDLHGLCCITTKESESYLYITQLRPNNAQMLFPCFDQANLLACFQLNLVTSSKQFLKPASNTRAEKFITDFPEESLTTVAFNKTTRMHPSKFFLALGNYVHSEPYVTKSGFLIVVISRPEIYDSLKEVPKLIKAIIETLTKYFNCPVPSNKLDVILVPKKWPLMSCAGNPGILVCEEYLLTNLKKKTCVEFVKSITFLVHELCHLWLGGDVTVDNWNDVWILEGIVSVVAHECCELMFSLWYDEWIPLIYQLFPLLNFESDINTVFNKQDAMLSHVFCENSRDEFISAKCKSLALLRMIWSVSPTSFRVVLVNMINRKEKVNYLPLWKDIFADNSVEEFLDQWKNNNKYPVISLRTTYKDNSQILTQAAFKKLTDQTIDEKTTWTIPIKYIDLKNPQNVLHVWFSSKASEAHIQNIKGKWIKLNWHQRGFYRVNYTYDQWAHFTEMLNKNPLLLDHQDRANLVDDAFMLAAANYFQYHIPLDLSSYITHGEERHYLPLVISFRYLKKLYLFFHESEYQRSLQRYIHYFLDKYLAQNVWKVNMKSPTETLRRVEIIHTACWSGHQPVLDKMKELFLDWLDGNENSSLHVDLLNNVVKYGLAGTDDKDLWRHVFQVFKSSKNLNLRSRLWSALSKTKDEPFLKGMINAFISKGYSLEKTLDRLKDTADNPLAAGIILDYIFANIPSLFTVTNNEALKALECLKKIVYFKNDEISMTQIEKYVKPMEHFAQAREICETIAEMRSWHEKQSDVVKEWLYHFFNQ